MLRFNSVRAMLKAQSIIAIQLLFVLLACGSAVADVMDVTNQITVKRSGFVYNRSTNTFDSTVTLTNTVLPLSNPVSLIVNNISNNNVSLANANGLTSDGNRFKTVSLNGGKFTAGQTLSVVLKFNNPTKSSFTFGIQVTANVDKISAVIGAEGAEIVHPIGVGITVMPGTFLVPTMVSIEPSALQSSSITNFPKEFILFGGVKISYTGEAGLPIDMFVPAQNNPNAKSFFAARMIEQTSTKRLSVVDTARINGSRLITNSPPFPGITEPGNYVFLGAPEGTSMAMFRVFQDNGEAARGATVDLAGNSSAFLGIASSNGFAAIPVNTQSSEIGVVAIGTDLNGTVLGNITNIPTNHLPPMPLPEDLPTLISHITDLFVAGLGFNTEDLPFAGPPSQCNLSPITVEPTEYPNIPGFLFSTGESFQIKVNCFLEIGQIDCTSSPEFSDIAELPITGYELIFTSYLPSAIPPSSPPPPITVGRNPGDGSKGFVTASLAGYGRVEVITQKYCLRKMTTLSGIPVPIMQLSLPQGALVKPIAVSPTLKVLTTGNGTVSDPLGIQYVNNGSYIFDYGHSITLTAAPDTGFRFVRWGQDCSGSGSALTTQINLTGDKTCTAEFSTALSGNVIESVSASYGDGRCFASTVYSDVTIDGIPYYLCLRYSRYNPPYSQTSSSLLIMFFSNHVFTSAYGPIPHLDCQIGSLPIYSILDREFFTASPQAYSWGPDYDEQRILYGSWNTDPASVVITTKGLDTHLSCTP